MCARKPMKSLANREVASHCFSSVVRIRDVKGVIAATAERFIPPGLSTEAGVRGRFFVQGWLVGFIILIAASLAFASSGLWWQVLLNLLVLLTGVFGLQYFRRTGKLDLPAHLTLVTVTLAYGLATLAQDPPDATNLAYLTIVPLLASFVFGSRAALIWALIPSAWAAVVLQLANEGIVVHQRDPSPALSGSTNMVALLLTVWALSSRLDAVRAEALQRAQAADRAKSAFLATISHEIRTPMNGVLGMTELLLQEEQAASIREQLTVIQRSGHLMVALINDVLDFAKIEAGRLSLERTDFSLRHLLEDVERLFRPTAQARGLRFQFELDPSLPEAVQGDPFRLQQVLGNLVSNALKFTERGGVTVRIRRGPATSEPVQVHFEVEDTGIGIAPEALPRLFGAFEQGDGSTTRRFGGTGLGLALSQQLVTLMGGSIQVDSQPGRGSRFSFSLSFSVGEARPRDASELDAGGLEWLRVLVVDDNAVNRLVATSLVKRAGCQVETATNGREAVEALNSSEFSLVLMDCHMPVMDGFQATEQIRALGGAAGQTPIVALTASTSADDLEACRRSGMNDCLAKPISWEGLRKVLQLARRPG